MLVIFKNGTRAFIPCENFNVEDGVAFGSSKFYNAQTNQYEKKIVAAISLDQAAFVSEMEVDPQLTPVASQAAADHERTEILKIFGDDNDVNHDLLVWHQGDEVAQKAGQISVLNEVATFNKIREAIRARGGV